MSRRLDGRPRQCGHCGDAFYPKVWSQKTCSAKCREARLRAWHAAWKRRDWARKHPKVKEDRACIVCRKPFEPGMPWAKACSAKCRAQHKRDLANAHTAGIAEPTGDTRHQCLQCGNPFLGHPNAKVCSAKCMRLRKRDAQRAGKVWHCIACGEPFEPQKNNRYTCSPACRRAAMARKNKRAATPERNRAVAAKVRQRKQADPSFRQTLSLRDRRQKQKQLLLQASLDVMRINEYEDRIGHQTEERNVQPGSPNQGDAVALDRGSQG